MGSADVTVPLYGIRNRVDRTGPAVRAALDPDRRVEFEAEFRAALARVDDDLDLTAAQQVIDRWWPQAILCANPEIQAGADAERRRIASGDPTVIAETWYPPGHPYAPSRTA